MDERTNEQILSDMIERKINKRNEIAQKQPRNDALVNFLDTEISELEKIEIYLANIHRAHARLLIDASRKGFANGVQAGKLEAITGRPHPEYLFR